MTQKPGQEKQVPPIPQITDSKSMPASMGTEPYANYPQLLRDLLKIAEYGSLGYLTTFNGREYDIKVVLDTPAIKCLAALKRNRNYPVYVAFAPDQDRQLIEVYVRPVKPKRLINPKPTVKKQAK